MLFLLLQNVQYVNLNILVKSIYKDRETLTNCLTSNSCAICWFPLLLCLFFLAGFVWIVLIWNLINWNWLDYDTIALNWFEFGCVFVLFFILSYINKTEFQKCVVIWLGCGGVFLSFRLCEQVSLGTRAESDCCLLSHLFIICSHQEPYLRSSRSRAGSG